MPAPFVAALQRLDASTERVFAEQVEIRPMATSGVNGRPAPDPERAAPDGPIPAHVYRTPATLTPTDGRGTGREDKIGTTARVLERRVSVARAALGGLDPRRGDRVVLLDEPGRPVCAVATVDRAGSTRIVLTVIEIGAES